MHISRSAAVIQSRGATFHIHHYDSLLAYNYLQISTVINDIAHHRHHTARSAAVPFHRTLLTTRPWLRLAHGWNFTIKCGSSLSVCLSLCTASILITSFLLILRLGLFNWHVWVLFHPPLHNVSRPVFTTDTRCVHWAVRTESVNTIQIDLSVRGVNILRCVAFWNVAIDSAVCW